jgi:hypothetical protein
MTLSIVLATRGRPALLMSTLGTTLRNVSRDDTTMLVCADADDVATVDALREISHPRIKIDVREREDSLGEKYNRVLSVAPAQVYLVMVDYAPHITAGFDQKIVDAAASFPDGIGVVYNHLANDAFPQINAVTHRLAELMGGIYPAHWPYWFVDLWLDDIARMIGRIAIADVWIDTSKRPGTMDRREPAFWASLYDSMTLRRRKIAHTIVASDGFIEPVWRKQCLLSPIHYGRIEKWSQMVTRMTRDIKENGDPPDERYARIRRKAQTVWLKCAAEIEDAAV